MSINFQGVQIIDREVQVLKKLEKMIGRQLNHVKSIEYSVVGFMVENGQIIALGLYGCEIEQIPKDFFTLTSLRMLNLWANQLSELPTAIEKLSSLIYLNLETNQLKNLPDELFSLTSLQKLYLGDNQLTNLPAAIGRLKNSLIYLNLNRNRISELPNELFSLTSLKTLGLSYNPITELPEDIGKLISLEKLTLEGLNLKELPKSLKSLPLLKEIYFK